MPSSRISTITESAERTLDAQFDEIDAAGLAPEQALLAKFGVQQKMDTAELTAMINIQKDEHDQLMRVINNVHV